MKHWLYIDLGLWETKFNPNGPASQAQNHAQTQTQSPCPVGA